MKGINDGEIYELIGRLEKLGVSEIKLLDLIKDLNRGPESNCHRLPRSRNLQLSDIYMPLSEIANHLKARAVNEETVFQGGFGHPLLELRFSSGIKVTIKDHTAGSWHNKSCEECLHYPCHDAIMALRLTTDLRLQMCLLHEDNFINLAPYISGGFKKIAPLLEKALEFYNTAHFNNINGTESSQGQLHLKGGLTRSSIKEII